MNINGKEAAVFLATIEDKVALHRKDNTDKFWSYKLNSAKRTEFAFNPRTTKGLYVRVDKEPPSIAGINNVERITGKDVSTALDRVFTGGIHKANYVATIESIAAFKAFIEYYESL